MTTTTMLKQVWPWLLMAIVAAPNGMKALTELHTFLKEAVHG